MDRTSIVLSLAAKAKGRKSGTQNGPQDTTAAKQDTEERATNITSLPLPDPDLLARLKAAVLHFDHTLSLQEPLLARIEKGNAYVEAHPEEDYARSLLNKLKEEITALEVRAEEEAKKLLELEALYVKGRGNKVCRQCWQIIPEGEWCRCMQEGERDE